MEDKNEISMLGLCMNPSFENFDHSNYQNHISQLDTLFLSQKREIEEMNIEELKVHQLPLARVKKIMKADEDVRMISAETPALFAKACEMFILEVTHRSWIHTEEGKRRTLQRNDIAACIARTDIFDFLQDMIPGESKSLFKESY
ncbi:unnamed protein product [Blepharisma stoltei]|uniref:Core Histone H2A/H2B/H3 domain-containing protein n=1 Tax=Blepharisma stoltei TaxID=1481888 RepID=A0AAU9IP72_9CILI|nr:unnamed protein product [Blepharisma stoltei]